MQQTEQREKSPLAGELTGRVAVVTGSTSGMGLAIALELAAAGADVLVHGRSNEQGAAETVAAITAMGRGSKAVLCDLSESTNRENLLEQAWQWRGGVDIWVNNAGVDVLTGAAANWSFEKKLEALWRVDVAATIHLSRQIGARMRAAAGGAEQKTIINMSWDQAARGMEGESGEMFAAAKGAIAAFSKSLARSLAPDVRVNCLAPGWIRTAWGEQAPDEWQQRALHESLLGRWGTPEDVARVARFLASPAAGFMTGQVVEINGGFRGG